MQAAAASMLLCFVVYLLVGASGYLYGVVRCDRGVVPGDAAQVVCVFKSKFSSSPAGEPFLLMAANEAEKSSNITLVDVKAVGAFGRLTLAGREGDVEEAAAAAMRAIDIINR